MTTVLKRRHYLLLLKLKSNKKDKELNNESRLFGKIRKSTVYLPSQLRQ